MFVRGFPSPSAETKATRWAILPMGRYSFVAFAAFLSVSVVTFFRDMLASRF